MNRDQILLLAIAFITTGSLLVAFHEVVIKKNFEVISTDEILSP